MEPPNWNDTERRLQMVPGKETLAALNSYLQQKYGVTVTTTLIVDSFRREEVDPGMVELIDSIDRFAKEQIE